MYRYNILVQFILYPVHVYVYYLYICMYTYMYMGTGMYITYGTSYMTILYINKLPRPLPRPLINSVH